MELIGNRPVKGHDMDIFSYNIVPDILSIHKNISSTLTHGISRFQKLPEEHGKASYVQFHLMVDDLSHYGNICREPVTVFDPDAGGYSYVKGRSLIPGIMDLYERAGEALSIAEAAYRSHMMVEMAFDHVLITSPGEGDIIGRFCESLAYTVSHGIGKFRDTMEWLYGIDAGTAEEAIREARNFYDMERMRQIKSIESRTALFIKKFGLDGNDDVVRKGVRNLILEGTALTGDYRDFLRTVAKALEEAGLGRDHPGAMPLS